MKRLLANLTLFSMGLLLSNPAWSTPIVDGQRTIADGYSHSWMVTLTEPGNPGNQLTDGRLYTYQDGVTKDLYVLYEVSTGFNDNTYGVNATDCWDTKGHTFNDLLKSDRVGFVLRDMNDQVLLDGSDGSSDLVIDYLATFDEDPAGTPVADFYRSAGVVEGKNQAGPGGFDSTGTVVTASKGETFGGSGVNTAEGGGDLTNVPLAETSLGRNMSLFPGATTDSSLAASWENQQIFEIMIAGSVFSGTTFDLNNPAGIVPELTHASPACFASDTPDVVITNVPEPTTLLLAFLSIPLLRRT